jgi:hypothetical protein
LDGHMYRQTENALAASSRSTYGWADGRCWNTLITATAARMRSVSPAGGMACAVASITTCTHTQPV